MTQPTSHPDGPDRLTRRDLLRLGAASAGAPLIALAAGEPRAPSVSPPLPNEDHAKARAQSVDNLKVLGIALTGFVHSHGGRFPAPAIRLGGKPLLSWRVALLPFLDARLYRRFHLDEPWDGPHNKPLLKEMPPEYAPVVGDNPAPHSTYYQAFVGPGTLFDGEQGTRAADVTDGVGFTLMVVEAAEPVPWTKPADIVYSPSRPLPRLGGQFADGFYVAFADGSARFLSHKVAPATLRALIERGDGEPVTFDKLGPWWRPRRQD